MKHLMSAIGFPHALAAPAVLREVETMKKYQRASRVGRLVAVTALTLVFAPPLSEGQTADQLATCSVTENDIERLQCYDALMVRDRVAELEAEKALMWRYGSRHPEILRINAEIRRERDQLAPESR